MNSESSSSLRNDSSNSVSTHCNVCLSFSCGVEVAPQLDAQAMTPLAPAHEELRPNVMVLLDRSGSMTAATPTSAPLFAKSRLLEVKEGMDAFLKRHANVARFGLTMFPAASGQCVAPTAVDVDFPAPAVAEDLSVDVGQAQRVASKLMNTSANGGTPTSAALRFVRGLPNFTAPLDGRPGIVVLVTDGLPNCNEANLRHQCSGGNSASVCTQPNGDCRGDLCALGILDDDGTLAEVTALRALGVKTVVIGFGEDMAASTATATLNAMALAGGLPRACGETCDGRSFYLASNAAELEAALGLAMSVTHP